jgi:hypothetical protein
MSGIFISTIYMITMYGVLLEKMNYILKYVIRNVKYSKVKYFFFYVDKYFY